MKRMIVIYQKLENGWMRSYIHGVGVTTQLGVTCPELNSICEYLGN